MGKNRNSPENQGKSLWEIWNKSRSIVNPHGSRDLLQALANLRIEKGGKKSCWADLGCTEKPEEIDAALTHHEIGLKSKQKVPKGLVMA